jgi:sterol desaturase/sphingolipid hydroxylase (fatty acid hydroxylase superfamily)
MSGKDSKSSPRIVARIVAQNRHPGLSLMNLALPTICIVLAAVGFFVFERLRPGRELPNAPGWYTRAVLVLLIQVAITLSTNKLWLDVFSGASLFKLAALQMPVVEGIIGWIVGTFFFYWWHRIRHLNGFWLIFHQVHHSPSRIEAVTSFYKHPAEIFFDSVLAAAVLYALLGCSLEGALWFNFFGAVAELFYHSNYKSPRWVRYFIQTPELHSIHHQLDVHHHNYSDLPVWDRLFGTYRDADSFAASCGFPRGNERKLGRMLIFQDVYND